MSPTSKALRRLARSIGRVIGAGDCSGWPRMNEAVMSADQGPGSGARTATETAEVVLQAVGDACRAPSVHNTQPWRWLIDGTRVELRVDRERQLMVSDPAGRNLLISCGAALHHLEVAAA